MITKVPFSSSLSLLSHAFRLHFSLTSLGLCLVFSQLSSYLLMSCLKCSVFVLVLRITAFAWPAQEAKAGLSLFCSAVLPWLTNQGKIWQQVYKLFLKAADGSMLVYSRTSPRAGSLPSLSLSERSCTLSSSAASCSQCFQARTKATHYILATLQN